MRMSLRAGVSALVLGCLLPGAAWAETADEADAAEASDGSSPAVTRIIVTARKRSEDLQDIPVAVSVITGEQLERAYIVNTAGVAAQVPALNYSSANPRNTAFTIRGLGSSVVAVSQANDGIEPGVGFYVDQVYHARPATAAFDFSDVERVEVLRGPQGTLFGKNTTAGAINIVSREPTFEPEANGEFSYGENQFLQVKASMSGPVAGDKVAFRLSALVTRRDGVIHNLVTGVDHNTLGTQSLRGQLLFNLSDAARLRVIGDFANFENDCCTQVPFRVGTSLRPAARQFPALAAGATYAPPSFNPYDRLTDIDADLGVNTNEGGVSAILDWDVGGHTLTSVSAWRFWNWDAANDRDYIGLPIQLTQHIPSRQDQYSQELRLASDGDGPVSYLGGLYFFRQVVTGRPISIYGPAGAYWLIGPTTGASNTPVPANLLDGYGSDGHTRFASDSYAAFGEASWEFVPTLTLTGGLRYTYETKEGDYALTTSGGLATTNTALINAKLSVLRPQAYSASDKDGSFSGRANLAWQPSDAFMGYLSYSRGFKSGGINMSGLPLNAQNQPVLATAVVAPEENETWELGIKTRLLDEKLLFNLTGYYIDVDDFQATVVDSSQTVALRGYLSNIPEVTVKGVEADLIAQPLPDLSLRASVAYSHGEYTDYPAGPCPLERQGSATAACDLTGQRLAGLPRWSASLAADYAIPAGPGEVVLHADSSWRSNYNGDSSLSQYTMIEGYNLTNASLGYRWDSGLEIAVFARNLFDADYIQNVTIQAGNSGLILATPSDPRMFGVTLRARI